MYNPENYRCIMNCEERKAADCINKTVNEMPDSYIRRELITSYTMYRNCAQRLNSYRTKQVQLQEEIESLKEQPKPKPKQDYHTLCAINTQYETQLHNQEVSIQSLYRTIKEKDEMIQKLSRELRAERAFIGVLQTTNQKYTARITELVEQVNQQPSQDILDTVSQLELTKAALSVACSTNDRLRKELNTVTQELNSMNIKLLEINRLSN